jgi:Xaa-Pro aminopeptidase
MHQERIESLIKAVRTEYGDKSLIFISNNPNIHRNFRSNSSLFYLTGITRKEALLIIDCRSATPREKALSIYTKKTTKQQLLWEGGDQDLTKFKKSLLAELYYVDRLEEIIYKLLPGYETVIYEATPYSLVNKTIAQMISETSPHFALIPLARVLSTLRIIKNRFEINQIKEAINLCHAAFFATLPLIKAGLREYQLRGAIEYILATAHAVPGFNTIVASGKNAATLHHHTSQREFKKDELVLIDFGAELNLYNCDISRTLPTSGRYPKALVPLYQGVLEAQKEAIKKVRSGVSMKELHQASLPPLIATLKRFKLLNGSEKEIIKNKSYKKYFPHNIGHPLGIDVHDITFPNFYESKLSAGTVITIEPGLYLQKNERALPACGIRIEDDILVTKNGFQLLTHKIPKEVEEIEELMA